VILKKRKQFDLGVDPNDPTGGAGAGGFQQGGYESNIDPNIIFQTFFGGKDPFSSFGFGGDDGDAKGFGGFGGFGGMPGGVFFQTTTTGGPQSFKGFSGQKGGQKANFNFKRN